VPEGFPTLTGVLELMSIPGLQANKVLKLHKTLGISSLAGELEETARTEISFFSAWMLGPRRAQDAWYWMPARTTSSQASHPRHSKIHEQTCRLALDCQI
jgi:hypothetical protein